MVLDEPTDADEVFDIKEFQFIANREFLDNAKPIKVDYSGLGFHISSNMNFGGGCSSCGTGTCG